MDAGKNASLLENNYLNLCVKLIQKFAKYFRKFLCMNLGLFFLFELFLMFSHVSYNFSIFFLYVIVN